MIIRNGTYPSVETKQSCRRHERKALAALTCVASGDAAPETSPMLALPVGLLALLLAGILLAPFACASGCPSGDDGCVTTCDTVLGYPAPLGSSPAWLLVPLAVAAVTFAGTRSRS